MFGEKPARAAEEQHEDDGGHRNQQDQKCVGLQVGCMIKTIRIDLLADPKAAIFASTILVARACHQRRVICCFMVVVNVVTPVKGCMSR